MWSWFSFLLGSAAIVTAPAVFPVHDLASPIPPAQAQAPAMPGSRACPILPPFAPETSPWSVPPEPPARVVEPLRIPEDDVPAPDDQSLFIVPNEFGIARLLERVRGIQGGAFVGPGTLGSLMLLGAQDRDRGILLDYDPRVVKANRGILDLINGISEAPGPGRSEELQRLRFLCGLFLAELPEPRLERIAGLPGGSRKRVAALLDLLEDAPVADAPDGPLEALAEAYDGALLAVVGASPGFLTTIETWARLASQGATGTSGSDQAHVPVPRRGETAQSLLVRTKRHLAVGAIRAMWAHYFRSLAASEAELEHLFPFSDSAWRRLSAMAGEGRIQVALGDFTRTGGALEGLARELRDAGVAMSVFYGSNAIQHFAEAPGALAAFVRNIEAFGWARDAGSVVLLAGTPGATDPIEASAVARLDDGRDVWSYHAFAPETLGGTLLPARGGGPP